MVAALSREGPAEWFSPCAARGHVFLHGLILWMRIFSLQAKEAGADDVLDISKCELSEVCSLQLPVLAHRSDSSVCFSLPAVRFSVMSMSLETEMALLLVHFLRCLLSSGFQVEPSSPFFCGTLPVLPDASTTFLSWESFSV